MSIESAIENAQQKVANAYTAVENKGGTLPATQNLSNLPTAINTISTAGTVETLNVTPTTSAQQFVPTGGVDGYNPVNVSAVTSSIDANITAGNIKDGVTILGVTGNFDPSPTIDSLSVTPSTSAQTFTASGGVDGYSPVTVSAVTSDIDSDIVASNIKSGVTILGVTGNVTELNGETRTVSITSTSGNTFTPSSGKNGITSIKVTPTNKTLSVTPTTSSQSISVPSGYSGYGTVSVSAVTSSIDSDIKATNIKSGVNILGVTGSVTELAGETRSVSLTNSAGQTFTPTSGKNGITSITVTPNNQARTVTPSTSSQSLTVNSGYSGNGTITVNAVTSAIDQNIVAGNIKNGVTILGTTGNYTGTTPTLTTKNITQNGTYNASSDNADGYSSVTVNVSGGGGTSSKGVNCAVKTDGSVDSIIFASGTFSNNRGQNVGLKAYVTIATSTTDFINLSGNLYPAQTPLGNLMGVEITSPSFINNIEELNLSNLLGIYLTNSTANTTLKKVDLSNCIAMCIPRAFTGFTALEEIKLTNLSDLSVSNALGGTASRGGAFANTAIQTLSFPALKSTSFGTNTNQFNYMLKGVTGCTVHFPSNLQSVIGSWSSVTSGFGGTNTTVLFDLPATT